MNDVSRFGAIAQLVEHLHGMQGVSGSSPLGSIWILKITNKLKDNIFVICMFYLNTFEIRFTENNPSTASEYYQNYLFILIS